MHIKDLNHRSVCILGFGREGQAMLRAIEMFSPEAVVVIADANENLSKVARPNESAGREGQKSKVSYQVGEEWLNDLDRFDIIIKSPGIPPSVLSPLPAGRSLSEGWSSVLTNSTQIFLDTVTEAGATVIGVTGSKGKSTTASLLAAILKHAGKDAYLVGNIGIPAIDAIEKAAPETLFVLEMSSYQLMDVTASPTLAVVTSFFPEHLDYHGSLKEYKNAKCHLTKFQSEADHVWYADDHNGAEEIAMHSPGHKHPYTEADAPLSLQETHLVGTHNLRNIAGAWKVAEHLGIAKEAAVEAIKAFQGLPHRLQNLGEYHGAVWIDDAISTTPESTVAAIQALGNDLKILICGGQDRGYDFTELCRVIDNSRIEMVIVMPDIASKVESQKAKVVQASSMKEAVEISKDTLRHSTFDIRPSIVLLSPASPSYNQYKNFEEKGEDFLKQIRG